MENETKKMSGCGVSNGEKLIFSCSGAADVGELADKAARRMTQKGMGKMFCLVGIGGQVNKIMQMTQSAHTILAIDGCPMNCAQKCLEKNGFNNFIHLSIEALGFNKGQTEIDNSVILEVVEKGDALINKGK